MQCCFIKINLFVLVFSVLTLQARPRSFTLSSSILLSLVVDIKWGWSPEKVTTRQLNKWAISLKCHSPFCVNMIRKKDNRPPPLVCEWSRPRLHHLDLSNYLYMVFFVFMFFSLDHNHDYNFQVVVISLIVVVTSQMSEPGPLLYTLSTTH